MAARATMADTILALRRLGAAGTVDYTLAGETWWSDEQLQIVLDRRSMDVRDEHLTAAREVDASGTAVWFDYESQYGVFETTDGGTAIFLLRDSTGTRAGAADWTADYDNGRVTFAETTGGTAYYLTGRSFDLNAAAADLWDTKAAHVSDRFDFAADGAQFKVSQMVEQYGRQARIYRSRARANVRAFVRADLDLSEW